MNGARRRQQAQGVVDPVAAVATSSVATEGGPHSTAPLSVVRRLFDMLHEEGIAYCHWKSNHTLAASQQGRIDLDLLVRPSAACACTQVLAKLGFKTFVPAPGLDYPAIAHLLALDRQTGNLAHVHLYYQLVTGEGHLKGYHLPWEDELLESRRLDAEHALYVADPNHEMIVFLVRSALKLRIYQRLCHSRTAPCFRGDALSEFRWLRQRATAPRVAKLARDLLGDAAAQSAIALLQTQSMRCLLAFRKRVVRALHLYRRYGPMEAVWHRWLKEWAQVRVMLNQRYLHRPFPVSRSPATGGRLIAFVGPDGSGKSALARETVRWLAQCTDALPVYFGSGNGPASTLRTPLQWVNRWLRTNAQRGRQSLLCQRRDGRLVHCGRAIWALVLSLEKRAKLRTAWRARGRGLLVVCDRFPQNQVMGYMDGPLLSQWLENRSRVLRALARWERAPYEWAELNSPDLVIRLDVPPEVAFRRKPEMDLEEIRKRDQASRRFRYSRRTQVAAVDAAAGFDEVVRRVKAMVWDII